MKAKTSKISVLPRITVDKNNILKEVELWHVVNGKYVHIVQTDLDTGEPNYYTNGKITK